jgi:hypothetical protein
MNVHRVPAGMMFLMSLVLAIHVGTAYAQQRQGVRPIVNAPEGCYVVEPVDPDNLYFFMRAQIQALSLARKGERANSKMLETKGGAPAVEADQAIIGLREERIRNTCSSFIVSYYVSSNNPAIAESARLLTRGYDDLGKMSDQMLGINLQKFIKKAIGSSPQRQLSTLMDKRQETINTMAAALIYTLKMFIDESRTNAEGKPDHLLFDKDAVAALLEYLRDRFPELKNNKGVKPASEFLKEAALIELFLTSGFKAANVP